MARNVEKQTRRIFGWCADGLHEKCWKAYVTVSEPRRTRHCECECHET